MTLSSPDRPAMESCDVQDIVAMEKSLAGVKRDISDMDDPEGDVSPTKKMKASADPDTVHDTTTAMNLDYSSEEPESTIAALKMSLSNANLELERWKYAFFNHSIIPSGIAPDPTMVVQAIQKIQASEIQLQEELLAAKRREDETLLKLASADHEISTLKSTVRTLKRLSKRSLPSMARPLLPKPANFDDVRLKNELEPAEKITPEISDMTAAVQIRSQGMHVSALNVECPENSGAGCESSEGKDEEAHQLMFVPPPNPKKKVGRPRKYLVPKEEDEGEEGKKNWMDSEVETLISLRWEMEPAFVKNAYKQGVDMWAQLQARMMLAIPGFTRSGLACQRKFNSLIKQHKKDVLEVKEGKHHTWDRHARKFYDSLDRWWHTSGTIMKHVATTNANNHSDGDAAHPSGHKEDKTRIKDDEEGEEAKKNWLESEVEALVSLRWEMEPEFVENAYKPGEDMWAKLQLRMTSMIPGFTRSVLACQRKFNALIKQHKKDVLELKESGGDHLNFKFFDILDRWWHTNGTVMKHVTTSPNESESLGLPGTVHLSEYLEDTTHTFMGEEDDEGEEGKKNWADSEVKTLIALRREMEPEFVKNWKKQGGNMWSKLRARMASLYPGFSRSPIACKRKFNTLVRQYKKDTHAMEASGQERHSCKHQGLLDQWLHTNGTSSLRHHNHASASGSDLELAAGDAMTPSNLAAQQDVSKPDHDSLIVTPYDEKDPLDNGDSIFSSLSKMVQNSHDLVDEMAKPSSLLDKMDSGMNSLIDHSKVTMSK